MFDDICIIFLDRARFCFSYYLCRFVMSLLLSFFNKLSLAKYLTDNTNEIALPVKLSRAMRNESSNHVQIAMITKLQGMQLIT